MDKYRFEYRQLERAATVFSGSMLKRLESKMYQGFSGWHDEDEISDEDLKVCLFTHIRRALVENEDGQWIDIANLAEERMHDGKG